MNIDYLHEFTVLAETLNYLEAAEQLFISQSALSKHIQALEHELGTPLFDRTTRRVQLNEYGRIFLPYARQISTLKAQYTSALSDALGRAGRNLKLGSVPGMSLYRITERIAFFKREHPDLSLDITEGDSEDLIRMLRSGRCELAFLRTDHDVLPLPEDFDAIPYLSENLVAVVSAAHPLANRRLISLRELSGEDFLMFQGNSQMYRFCCQACESSGFRPRIAFNGRRPENLADLAAHGLGTALLMKKQALALSTPNVRTLDLEPAYTNHIMLCSRKDHELSPAARAFAEFLKHHED